MTTRIKLRRDTASNWTSANPVLALAEPGLETDTNKVKYGDGTTAWTSLPYASTLPVGMVPSEWYGAPNLTNNSAANNDANYMQFQTQTDWVGNNDYGRSTLSWHDANVSMYSHVQADPYGVSIRNAEWFDGYQARYWEFQADGRTRFPNGLVFDTWNDSNITNDYIELYESDDSGESSGEYNAYVVQLQSITKYENENDYGRATLSWHDYDYSNYSHVHVDPDGASIRLADWSGTRGNYRQYWDFNISGNVTLPQGGTNTTSSLGQGPDSDWVDPNSNTWSIRQYNGGFSGAYDGTNPLVWFDAANSPLGNSQFRGAVIEYHAFTSDGTIVGTIHVANDYNPATATHTEMLSGGASLSNVVLWSPNGSTRGQLALTTTDNSTRNLMIQWTAKVFYGSELNC